MSTMLEEHPSHWVVSTVSGKGRQRKVARLRVAVGKDDPERLKAEIKKQCEAARREFGVKLPPTEPVV